MRRELERREPWPERIVHPDKKVLLQELRRAYGAGELGAVGPIRSTSEGYAVEVLRLKGRAVERRWVKPAAVAGGVVLSLGALALVGWWMAGAVTVALGAVSVPLVVGGLAVVGLMYLALRRGNPTGGGCETTVTIRHRHR